MNLSIIRNEANLKTFKLELVATSTRFAQEQAAIEHLEAKYPGFHCVAVTGAADATSVEILIRNY